MTVFTVLSEEEYQMTLQALDALFCKYLHKGKNAFASNHVKQTIHDADLMWASNMYVIIFKVNRHNFTNNVNFSLLNRNYLFASLAWWRGTVTL